MARIPYRTPAAAAAAVSTDPIVANGANIAATQWVDAETLGADGVALTAITTAGDGVSLELPNGTSGARFVSGVLVGDFLICGDLAFATDSDLNVNAGVEVVLAVAPGGLSGDILNANWYGIRLSGLLAQAGAFEIAYVKNSATVDQAWSGSPVRAGFKSVFASNQARIAIERVGTDLTLSLLSKDGSPLQSDTVSLVSADDADIMLWCRTNKVGCHAHLHNLATTGLGWVGGRLVASAA